MLFCGFLRENMNTNIIKRSMINVRALLFLSTTLFTFFSCSVDNESSSSKKVFRYNVAGVLGSLDPAFATDQSIIWATSQLYNGLLEFDENLNLNSCIAKQWEVSNDLKTYTFTLRDDVFFHDHALFQNGKGRNVTAYDFEYSFKRICDTTSIYNKGIWIFKNKVLKNRKGEISDTCFKAVNDTIFKIYLQKPSPQFLQVLAMNYAFVVPREITEHYGEDFRRNPIGTGPFKFSVWKEGNTLILLRNENYWRKDTQQKNLPYLDAVQVYFIQDKSQAFRAFSIGKIDFVSGVEEGSVDEFLYSNGTFKEEVQKTFNTVKKPYLNTEYIGCQLDPLAKAYEGVKDHPLWNRDFRKALNYSIDRNRLVVNLKNGLGMPAVNGVVPNAVPNYPNNSIKGYHFDSRLAVSHLEKSGWSGKTVPPIKLYIAKEHKSIGEFLTKSWEEVLGIHVQVAINEPKTVRSLANSGEAALFHASWLGDYPEAENYLALFHSRNFTPNGPNKVHYKNETFDSLYTVSSTILNDVDRNELYMKMDQLMINDAPIIPLFYDEIVRLSQKNIKNLKTSSMNLLDLERVDIKN